MREDLRKLKKGKNYVFTGYIATVDYQRLRIKNIEVYDESGTTVIGFVEHCHVAKKPFRNMGRGLKVRFTGKIHFYQRLDGSYDYSIIVNKARAY